MRVGLIGITDDATPARRCVQRMCPPLGLLYLRDYVRLRLPAIETRAGYEVEEILAEEPDVIGLSAVTENFPRAVATARAIRARTDAALLVGGPHVTSVPSLPEPFDAGVIGEGEETLCDMLRLFLDRGRLDPNDLLGVPGLLARHPRQGVVRTAGRPLIRPLDRIPFPRRDGLDASGLTHAISSRGCPYACQFCASPALWPGFRQHSAGHVAAELRFVKERISPPHVKFLDDLFIADRARLAELALRLPREGISFPSGMSAFARADLVDEQALLALASAGFVGLSLGIESGSARVLHILGKRTSLETNQRAIDLLADAGFQLCCSFIIGVPGETEDDLGATLRFIERNRRAMREIEVCPAIPFPGTPLWQLALKRGLVNQSMDWSRLRDWSHFADFDLDSYLYLNPAMPIAEFARWCEQFRALYRDISTGRCILAGDGTATH